MDLATIEIDPAEARERLAEYESVIKAERTQEDEAIAAGFRAAARGLPVIKLSDVIRIGGVFETSKRPKIAVARADAKRVRVDVVNNRDVVFSTDLSKVDRLGRWSGMPSMRQASVGAHHVRINEGLIESAYVRAAETIVPIVPPRHRPKIRRLHSFHILWEVERWDPTPPVDPALIKHIRGDLWAVMATWDLTELERAVLSARF